ncbi:MAG: hypothetical protein HYS08_00725 [Chlamydiae bacterium]|nr:hypothetical protein [Chlamydiota bacterium]MBI3265907.1 hypothetical protein [Chlamydiota bacterium]
MNTVQFSPLSILKNAVLNDHVAHAYLFHGSGLKNLQEGAVWLAQALNCSNFLKEENPCGQCESCGKIFRKVHPDVRFYSPQGALRMIRMDEIRELQSQASFKPFEGKVKVEVIEEADCLHPAAANALLKILEEPPQKTFLVLFSQHPEKLLPTLRSRCQDVFFKGDHEPAALEIFQKFEKDSKWREVLWEGCEGNSDDASACVENGSWVSQREMLQFFEEALSGSWIQAFKGAEKIHGIIEEDLKQLEGDFEQDEQNEDPSYRKKMEEEKKAFLSGERLRKIREFLKLILIWGRIRLVGEKAKDENSFPYPLGSLPLWLQVTEEAARFLERGTPLKWVLEVLMIKLKTISKYEARGTKQIQNSNI